MNGEPLGRRVAIPVAVATAFALIAGLRLAGQETLYDRILGAWGIIPFDFPFVDIHGVLSAIQCSARGIDVYVTNPCDVLGRVFFYSPLLLWASPTGIGIGATPVAGLTVDAAFILSLFLLPVARGPVRWFLLFMAVFSTMTVFALERANIDALIFALAGLAGTLLLRPGRMRYAGYAVVMVAALIKFYPAILFILALRERPRRFLYIALVAVVPLAALSIAYRADIALALTNLPHGLWFTDMFGAVNLPYGLAALGLVHQPRLLWAACVTVAGVAMMALGTSRTMAAAYGRLTPVESILLIIGAALMAGCFFAGQSVGYRGVFLILAMPGLLALAHAAPRGGGRMILAATPWLVVLLMWGEFFRHGLPRGAPHAVVAFWLGRELAWWSVMIVLGGVLVRFAVYSETGRVIVARLAPWRPLVRNPLGLPGERNPS